MSESTKGSFNIYKSVKKDLPPEIMTSVVKLLPIYLVSSIFDVFGLFAIFPVIRCIINPSYIQENSILQTLYQKMGYSSNMSFIVFLFSAILVIFIAKNAAHYFLSKRQSDIAFGLAAKLCIAKFSDYLRKPYSFHNDSNTAILLRNFVQIPFELVSFVVLPLITIINELIILLILVVLLTIYDPILFLSIVVFVGPLFIVYNKLYRRKLQDISNKRNREGERMYKFGLQSMDSYREMMVFDKIGFFQPLFSRTVKIYTKTLSDSHLMNSFSSKIVETVAVFAIFSIFICGYWFNKDLTNLAQFLIVFALAAYRIMPSLNKIILSSNYIKSSAYIFNHYKEEKINGEELFEAEEIAEESTSLRFDKNCHIRNLSFSYSNQIPVLKNIQLNIPKGQTIGIIGSSGSGKTTLLNILLRLYNETNGGIYVDETKIDEKNKKDWYKLVSYVPQNTTLLDGSIAENIAYGIEEARVDVDKLKRVIELSQLKDFIDGLENGFDTMIGENGVKISGGQRQRVGIARALYHGGEILIFDEATSSLDSETEMMLTESIYAISQQKFTIIIVAHRIQTLKYCDIIYKLENGELMVDKEVKGKL